jgi:hypothetical protein
LFPRPKDPLPGESIRHSREGWILDGEFRIYLAMR